MCDEDFDSFGTHLIQRMIVKKENITPGPRNLGFLDAVRIMLQNNNIANLVG